MMERKLIIRYIFLGVLLLPVWVAQSVPVLGNLYSQTIYPVISRFSLFFPNLFLFAIGDLLIFGNTTGVTAYPFCTHIRKKLPRKKILLCDGEYLLWVYIWFYLARELNCLQPNFYQHARVSYTVHTPKTFQEFMDNCINSLSSSLIPIKGVHEEQAHDEAVKSYNRLSNSLGVHYPPFPNPQIKMVMFTLFISMVRVTGSIGSFFYEFILNGDLLPINYLTTCAYELAHLLGISSEAEANFHAYQVCTRSQMKRIHFSGYLSILNHVLGNAWQLLSKKKYADVINRIRPEIIELTKENQEYWMAKYGPLVDDVQDWIYGLYLRGNKIKDGRKNCSEMIGLLASYRVWKAKSMLNQ